MFGWPIGWREVCALVPISSHPLLLLHLHHHRPHILLQIFSIQFIARVNFHIRRKRIAVSPYDLNTFAHVRVTRIADCRDSVAAVAAIAHVLSHTYTHEALTNGAYIERVCMAFISIASCLAFCFISTIIMTQAATRSRFPNRYRYTARASNSPRRRALF